jgi:uncharacterized protein (TIGR02145 family)
MKTKSKVFIYLFAMLGMTLLISVSCKKKNDDTNNPPVTTVTDQDGNVYHTVTIGTQVWMVENLKTTKYRNGDGIQNVTDSIAWWNLTSGAYCIYRNDVNNLATYGRLYNWYAVIDSRKLTPAGWHIPTDAEWTTLTDYLGSTCGDKLKEKGPNHWGGDNTATNETGFTALPGGNRAGWQGEFLYIGQYGSWWSSTDDGSHTWIREIVGWDDGVLKNPANAKSSGYSVRCVKD